MIITTAGMDLSSPCYTQEYKYCSDLLNPDIDVENDEYFADICELDPEDYADLRNLENTELWKKANPIRMSYPEGFEKIMGDYVVAKAQPEKMTAFLTKALNIWVQAREDGYMDMAKWKACEVEGLPIDLEGRPVYVGFDLSAKIDLCSVAFVVPYQSGKFDSSGNQITKYVVWSHSFIPSQEKLAEHIAKDKAPYDYWERDGYLSITNTPIVDQSQVMQYVLDEIKKCGMKVEYLCFDPANAGKIMLDLSNEGYTVEEVWQSHKHLNEATNGLREQVYSGNVCYLKNPLLNYAMGNAVIRQNNGLIKIDKDATTKRIDPVDALIAAFKLAMYHEFDNDYSEYIDKFLEDILV